MQPVVEYAYGETLPEEAPRVDPYPARGAEREEPRCPSPYRTTIGLQLTRAGAPWSTPRGGVGVSLIPRNPVCTSRLNTAPQASEGQQSYTNLVKAPRLGWTTVLNSRTAYDRGSDPVAAVGRAR